MEDEASLEPEADEADLDTVALCATPEPVHEVVKTVTSAPGVLQIAPSTAYFSSGDGAFTMHVNGLGSFANDPIYGRGVLQTSVPTTKSACERTFVSAAAWGRNKNTGCWSLLGGSNSAGKWIQDPIFPFANSYCSVRTDTPDIDGAIFTQAHVSTSAYRNETFPIPFTVPLQVTSALVVEDY
jgi:hypothetical protein